MANGTWYPDNPECKRKLSIRIKTITLLTHAVVRVHFDKNTATSYTISLTNTRIPVQGELLFESYHQSTHTFYGFAIFYSTHWGRVTHICASKLTIIGSDNGLSPDRRQAIIWTNAGLLLIGPIGTNFSRILIEILTSSFKKMRLKVSSAKRRPFVSVSMC